MKRTEEIQDLYAFNRWANTRMREALSNLSADEFSRDLKNSFPSIRDTVLHVMSSEWVWLSRWNGVSPTAMPPEWATYDLAQITDEWTRLEAEQKAFAEQLNDAGLDRIVAYRNLKGESYTNALWQLMRHMVNHSTYHRGQVMTMLRQLGRETVSTDLVLWYRAKPQQ